jgi:hypothetical protein
VRPSQSGDKSPHSKRCRASFSAGKKITSLFCTLL